MVDIEFIRKKVERSEYEFAVPHFFEEMINDDLIWQDIELAIENGGIRREFTDDPRGSRYEIVGKATDGREIGIICRVKATGRVLFITTYELE